MFSRDYLNSLDNNYHPQLADTIQQLLQRATDELPLSLAEESFICGKMSILRDEGGQYLYDVKTHPACRNYNFITTYLNYHLNVNGHKRAFDMYGEIPYNERMNDAAFLEEVHQAWKQTLDGPFNTDQLIQHSQVEFRHQQNILARYCKANSIWGFYRDYLEKAVVLHSKFIYYLVKEYFDELGALSETITIFGKAVIIDSFCYIHIMFRHYAEQSKEYQLGKTYHFDTNIDYKRIPTFLMDLAEKLQSTNDPTLFQNNSIHFIFKGSYYTTYMSRFGGILRLATFFPVGRPKDLARMKKYVEVPFDQDLTFLRP